MSFSQMFPSSHNNNVCYKPFFNDIITTTNTNSNYYDQSSFFSHLPPSSPNFINPCCYDDLFPNQNGEFSLHHQEEEPQQQDQLKECSEILLMENINNTIFNFNNNNNTEDHHHHHLPESMNKKEVIIRKRCSKRDRHSKINTAQGPRDRRMRLSLKVAREFFDLQDKLSFDKASKTVEWLLLQARSAIMKLSGTTTSANVVVVVNQSASSTSECEVVSGIEDEAAVIKGNNNNDNVSKGKTNKAKKAKTCLHKASFHPQANKESRVRARAKARERTRKKIDEKLRELEEDNNINGGFINQLSCDWRRIEESAATHQNINPCISEVLKAPTITSPLATSESIDESWAAIGKWSPFPSLTDHLYNPEFPQEQNQITDFQTYCANQYGSHCDIVARQY